MKSYRSSIVPVDELPDDTRQQMAALYFRYYEGSDEETFQGDIDSKTEAIVLHAGDELAGFTLLHHYDGCFGNERARIVYSGDTIVDRAHWGQRVLAFSCVERMGHYSRGSTLPVYWFLVVKGHRTYRYLSVYCRSFYPHWSIDRSDLKPLADELAAAKFGSAYNKNTGVVEDFYAVNENLNFSTRNNVTKPFDSNRVSDHVLVCIVGQFND